MTTPATDSLQIGQQKTSAGCQENEREREKKRGKNLFGRRPLRLPNYFCQTVSRLIPYTGMYMYIVYLEWSGVERRGGGRFQELRSNFRECKCQTWLVGFYVHVFLYRRDARCELLTYITSYNTCYRTCCKKMCY